MSQAWGPRAADSLSENAGAIVVTVIIQQLKAVLKRMLLANDGDSNKIYNSFFAGPSEVYAYEMGRAHRAEAEAEVEVEVEVEAEAGTEGHLGVPRSSVFVVGVS